jgi:hypothetical protein
LYQIRIHPENDRRGKAEIRGRLVFAKDVLLDDLSRLLANGAVMRKTKLSPEFDFKQWKTKHGSSAIPLFLITESANLRLFTVDSPPVPTAGQTIIALGQPEPVKPTTVSPGQTNVPT